jgi:hypothetical protein
MAAKERETQERKHGQLVVATTLLAPDHRSITAKEIKEIAALHEGLPVDWNPMSLK